MFELHRLSPDDDPPLARIVSQSFQSSAWETYRDRVGVENLRVLRDARGIVGGLAMYPMGQWFGGRSVATAGFAAVAIAPEHRGTGAARELMTLTLRELRAAGTPLATLYASTQTLYRKVGFEQAGSRFRHAIATQRIGDPSREDRSLPMSPIEPLRHEPLHALYRRRAERTNGHLDRSRAIWERVVTPPEGIARGYLVGAADAPEGYVVFTQARQTSFRYDLAVRDLVAETPAAARRLWAFFADHRSLAEDVAWYGPPNDPFSLHQDEQAARVLDAERWLLRLVDAPKALAERGYPAEALVELDLEVTDAVLPENAGRFVVAARDGRAEVRRGGRGELSLDVRGLASLYAGFTTPRDLVGAGLAAGSDASLDAARRLFAGPTPWMPDMF